MHKTIWLVFVFLPLFLMSRPAHAYLDPGTANHMLQVAYLLFYSALGFVAIFFRRLKELASALRNKLTSRK